MPTGGVSIKKLRVIAPSFHAYMTNNLTLLCLVLLISVARPVFSQTDPFSKRTKSAVLTDSILHYDQQQMLVEFVKKELKYPDSARTEGIRGSLRLYCTLILEETELIK